MALESKFKLPFDLAFARNNAYPLDADAVWDNLDAAETYAKKASRAYVGQTIAVSADPDAKKNGLYIILEKGEGTATLKKVGGAEVVEAENYKAAKELSKTLQVGQLIDVKTEQTISPEDPDRIPAGTYKAGFYIVNAPGTISSLSTSTGADNEVEALKGRVDAVEKELPTIKQSVETNKTAISNEITAREEAIRTLKGTATADYDSLGEAEAKIKEAKTAADNAQQTANSKISAVNGDNTVKAETDEGKNVSLSLVTSDKGNVKFTQDGVGLSANITIAESDKNGEIKVDNKAVKVHGLQDLAYTQKATLVSELDGKYDAKNAASTVKTDLVGDAADGYNTLGKLEDKIIEEASTARAAENVNKEAIAAHETRIVANETAIKALSSATHFIGLFTRVGEEELPTDNIITDKFPEGHVPADGDVVLDGSKEYIFSAGAWVELGDTTAEANRIGDIEQIVSKEGNGTLQTEVAGIKTSLETGEIHDEIDAVRQSVANEIIRAEKAEKMAKTVVAQGANITVSASKEVDGEPTTYTVAATGLATTDALEQTNTNVSTLQGYFKDNGVANTAASLEGTARQAIIDEARTGYETAKVADGKYVAKADYIAYSQKEKDKLAGIDAGAQVNKIETITVNGASDAVSVSGKTVDIKQDTANVKLSAKLEHAGVESGVTMDTVLADIYAKLNKVNGAKVASVGAGDDSVFIGGSATAPTVKVQVRNDKDNLIQEDVTGGIFAAMYYEEEVPAEAQKTTSEVI